MNWTNKDTIAAISTAAGAGGIAIIRVSGPLAETVLGRVFRPLDGKTGPLESHRMTLGWVLPPDGGTPVDQCMAVLMRAPRSYTREDVAELQVHGGSFVARTVLERCLQAGARLAEPGEFTCRAFLNGRVDLSQAEAVMRMISARSERGRQLAMAQLQGGTTSFIRRASDGLYVLQARVEASLDYPEEVGEDVAENLAPEIRRLADTLEKACDERAGRIADNGVDVVLFGRPNVGKSSLLNALLGEDRAIVTDIPGTTRDTVRGELTLGPDLFRLTDTAGLRETTDTVEKAGVNRSREALKRADVALLVLDGSEEMTDEDFALIRMLRENRSAREKADAGTVGPQTAAMVVNKCDLPAGHDAERLRTEAEGLPILRVSAVDPQTLEPVRSFLREACAGLDVTELSQPRHIALAREAAGALKNAAEALEAGLSVDIAATDLNLAQILLGDITGDNVSERLLDEVFSTFCVGK